MCDRPEFDFDLMLSMSDEERLEWLYAEVEELIQSAPAHRQLKLRALQAKMDGIRNKVKNRLVAASMMSEAMHDSFNELRAILNEFPHIEK